MDDIGLHKGVLDDTDDRVKDFPDVEDTGDFGRVPVLEQEKVHHPVAKENRAHRYIERPPSTHHADYHGEPYVRHGIPDPACRAHDSYGCRLLARREPVKHQLDRVDIERAAPDPHQELGDKQHGIGFVDPEKDDPDDGHRRAPYDGFPGTDDITQDA